MDYTFSPVNRNRGGSRSRRVLDLEPENLQAVEEEPNVSCRRFALRIGVSSFTIWSTLHEQGLYPYHLQRVQHLKPEDPRRIAFCQWLLQKIDEEPNFLSIILTTDEAGFTRDGVFNSHNTHIWSEENPHKIRERGFQQRFSINVWAGKIANRLIRPHVLETISSKKYIMRTNAFSSDEFMFKFLGEV
jgi:hypothetical protein